MALALGLLGGALNQRGVPLLTGEAPEFLFGGICAWLAFFWCGRLPGLAAALATALVGGGVDPASWTIAEGTTLCLLVLEAWGVTTVAVRTGSVVVGALAFWLLAGSPALFAGQWLLGDLSGPLVALGLVVRIFNALINAVVVELLVRCSPLPHSLHRIELTASTTLEHYIVRRILPVVIVPLLGIGLFHTRTRFETIVERSRLDALASSDAIVSALRHQLHPAERALARLARDLASVGTADAAQVVPRLETFLATERQAVAIAVVDASGHLVASIPTAPDEFADAFDVKESWSKHLTRARRLEQPVFSAFVPDLVPWGAARAGALLTLAGQPLASRVTGFDGLVLVALDSQPLLSVLNNRRTDRSHAVTVTDTSDAVVASLDPMLPPGMLLPRAEAVAGGVSGRAGQPPERRWIRLRRSDGEVAHGSADNGPAAYSAEQRDPLSGWRVGVTLPRDVLHARLVRATAGVLALAAALLAGLYLVVLAVARHIASPLVTLRQTTATIAAGQFEGQPLTIATSPIRELRSIGTDLRRLKSALQSYDRMRRAREQETEARLRHTFEQVAVGLAHVSLQGIWLRVNTRLCDALGYAPDDLFGRSMDMVLQPEDRQRVEALVGHVITGQQAVVRVELALVGGDHRLHWAHFTVSLGRDAAGRPAYLILVLEDMSARRALEEQLRRSQKLESVGRLAGGVAHDFNNLLTAIVGHSDFLHEGLPPDDPRRHDVEQVRDAARRAANLTRQLLAFAKRQVLEPRVLNVNELAGRMHRLLERLIGEDIDLRLQLAPNLCNVSADAGQLEQVLLNLVVNARDAMPHGGVLCVSTANVQLDRVGAEPLELDPGDYVQVMVEDSGHGMTEDVRARAFEPFFTTKGTDKGTGLGLATCYGIVKQLGGDIDVESAPGRGAMFRILLPATREPIAALEMADSSPRRGHGERIMLVEDEETVSRLASRTLRQQGYEVIEASDGVEALERLTALDAQIHVLVTDLVMPRMGGQELALHAQALNPDLRVVFISGYLGEAAARLDLRNSGAVFLQKPFRPRTLVHVVQAVLETVKVPTEA